MQPQGMSTPPGPEARLPAGDRTRTLSRPHDRPTTGHDRAMDDQAMPFLHAIDERLPIQGIKQRLAHAPILEKGDV